MLDIHLITLSTLTALVFSLASVTAKPLVQFKPRAEVDTCADVDSDLTIGVVSFGRVTLCTCLSQVPNIVANSGTPAVNQAVSALGAQAVTKALNQLTLNSPTSQDCVYPDGSTPDCQTGNPCGFQCTGNFVPYPTSQPTQCLCPSPYIVCNGQCGPFGVCSSQAPYPYSKRELNSLDADCAPGWKLCKIPGREILECVDVMNDLWSCGGCEIPSSEKERVGVDCTVIPNVSGVSCMEGLCKVESCRRGFQLSDDETSCAPYNTTISQYPVFVQNGRGPLKV